MYTVLSGMPLKWQTIYKMEKDGGRIDYFDTAPILISQ